MRTQCAKIIGVCLVLVACVLMMQYAFPNKGEKESEAALSELSGIYHCGEKTVETTYIVLDGSGERCSVRGDLLTDVKAGTRIYVKGVLKSYLFEHKSGPEVAPPPFRKGWVIYMDVKELKTITEPFGGK